MHSRLDNRHRPTDNRGMPRGTDKELYDATQDFPRLTIAAIESLKNKGYNQSDIARMFGVSRQAVSWHKQHYGGRLTPREMVLQHFPWIVPEGMNQSSPFRRLRDHGEYMATGGVGMSDDKLKRLRTFYQQLREHVLEFDPTIPPDPGLSINGGFAYRPRRKQDGDMLIRVNEYTHMSEQGRMIWRFPPVEP